MEMENEMNENVMMYELKEHQYDVDYINLRETEKNMIKLLDGIENHKNIYIEKNRYESNDFVCCSGDTTFIIGEAKVRYLNINDHDSTFITTEKFIGLIDKYNKLLREGFKNKVKIVILLYIYFPINDCVLIFDAHAYSKIGDVTRKRRHTYDATSGEYYESHLFYDINSYIKKIELNNLSSSIIYK